MSPNTTHMVVLRRLQQYPEQPVGPRAAAQRQHRLIQVLLGLQGQRQLKGQENTQCVTFSSPLFQNGGMSTHQRMRDVLQASLAESPDPQNYHLHINYSTCVSPEYLKNEELKNITQG